MSTLLVLVFCVCMVVFYFLLGTNYIVLFFVPLLNYWLCLGCWVRFTLCCFSYFVWITVCVLVVGYELHCVVFCTSLGLLSWFLLSGCVSNLFVLFGVSLGFRCYG